MAPQKDHRWASIVQHVPSDVLIALARQEPGHSLQKLCEDQESRVDEVFRVCDEATIQTLYEEFPGLYNSVTWFYRPESSVSKALIDAALRKPATRPILAGITPETVNEEPQLYKIEQLPTSILFRYVAADRKQHLPVDFGGTKAIELLSYYDVVLHFSEITVLVFGPTSNVRADKVMGELQSFLGINGSWMVLKPSRGGARQFYHAIKRGIGGLLIETKRHDPRDVSTELMSPLN